MEKTLKNWRNIIWILSVFIIFGISNNSQALTLANNAVESIAIQSNGKILIGGQFTFFNDVMRIRIARINSDGTLDNTFTPGGGANSNIYAIAVQSNNKIIIGGWFSAYDGIDRNGIARLNEDGSLDTTFNPGNGIYNNGDAAIVDDIIIQSNGKIIIRGSFTSYNGIARYGIARINSDGSLDTAFDPGASVNGSIVTAVIQSDGKILIGGYFSSYNGQIRNGIARLNPDGALDVIFNAEADSSIEKIIIQPDGKIVINGGFSSYNNIVRLNEDGSLDETFSTLDNYSVSDMALQNDGKIVIMRNYENFIRLNIDGSFDIYLDIPGFGIDSVVKSFAVQSDGKIIAGGAFYDPPSSSYIAQINSNGSFGNWELTVPVVTTEGSVWISNVITSAGGYIDDTGGENPQRFIDWGTEAGVYTDSCSAGVGGVGSYSCLMTGISLNSTYYYRARATNSSGTVYGSEIEYQNTLPDVTTNLISNITTISAIGNASVNYVQEGTAEPERTIRWGIESGSYTNSCSPGVGGLGDFSCNITGLTPNTTYYARAYAYYSEWNYWDNGREIIFQTLSGNATVAPTLTTLTPTQSPSQIAETSATAHATIITTGGENPERIIEWGTASNTYTNSCSSGTGSTGDYSCNMPNLLPSTTYYLRAKATNSAGTTNATEVSFTTRDTFLEIPDPDETKVTNAINSGYLSLGAGSVTSTNQTTTNVGIRMTRNSPFGLSSVTFPASTIIKKSDDTNINIAKLNITDATNLVRETYANSRGAIKIGIDGVNLGFSTPITISIEVGTSYNGGVMTVFYKNDTGDTQWKNDGTSCIIADGKCNFQTNHATTYTVNTDGHMVGDTGINLNTDIQEVISLDCGTSIVNMGNLTPGTPVTGSSTCLTTTNANGGYNLSVRRDDSTDTTMDKTTEAITNITDKTPWNPTTPNATTWSGTGLGFTVYDSTANKNTTWWGTGNSINDSNNLYAGFSPTQTDIMRHTTYSNLGTTTSIGYKLDVPPSQKSGAYSGAITYQVTTTP